MRTQWHWAPKRVGVRLDVEEVDLFLQRVRLSTKADPSQSGSSPWPHLLAVRAAWKTFWKRSTCADFRRGVAYMDHSDEGVRRLFERNGLSWENPEKLRLRLRERVLAGLIALRVVVANHSTIRSRTNASGLDTTLAMDRLVAGAGCFARFLAQAHYRPESWRGIFVSSDISFLRMFACFAASRAERTIAMMDGHHSLSAYESLPFPIAHAFALNTSTIPAAVVPAESVTVDVLAARARPSPSRPPFDVGVVTDNAVVLAEVWVFAREIVQLSGVRSVVIRLHPGSGVRSLPTDLHGVVDLADTGESLSEFAERIDFALVSRSSAVRILRDLFVPCFHTYRLYHQRDARRDLDSGARWDDLPDFRGPVSLLESQEFAELLAGESGRLRERRPAALTIGPEHHARVRAALEPFV